MKRMILTAFVFLLPTIAMAQQQQLPPQQQTPLERALSGKLMEEINSNIQYRSALVAAQEQLAKAERQLADEAKAKDKAKAPIPAPEPKK